MRLTILFLTLIAISTTGCGQLSAARKDAEQPARQSPTPRERTLSNLKEIQTAVHRTAESQRKIPPYGDSSAGFKPHSVHLLPYMDQGDFMRLNSNGELRLTRPADYHAPQAETHPMFLCPSRK